jgi:hypothetical protein
MNAERIAALRELLLVELLPLAAVATFPATLHSIARRKGFPEAKLSDIEAQLTMLTTLGKVRIVGASEVMSALKGYQLTEAGANTAEVLAYS